MKGLLPETNPNVLTIDDGDMVVVTCPNLDKKSGGAALDSLIGSGAALESLIEGFKKLDVKVEILLLPAGMELKVIKKG